MNFDLALSHTHPRTCPWTEAQSLQTQLKLSTSLFPPKKPYKKYEVDNTQASFDTLHLFVKNRVKT